VKFVESRIDEGRIVRRSVVPGQGGVERVIGPYPLFLLEELAHCVDLLVRRGNVLVKTNRDRNGIGRGEIPDLEKRMAEELTKPKG
jgi:hypothetical protein